MTYPNSGSSLHGGINSSLSTQIIIKVKNVKIGAIQSLTINQNRDMSIWEEIGTDGIVEIHPKGAAKIDLNVTRLVFDNLRLTEAFARGFINIQSQRFPFDIDILDKTNATTSGFIYRNISRNISKFTQKLTPFGIEATEPQYGFIVHTFHNCWFKSYSPTYRADNFIISEQANLVCEKVTSSLDGRNVANGGKRGVQYEWDSIERSTDLEGKNGRLVPVKNTMDTLNYWLK